jgi:phage repressor protein C with HTH and peptisase S24 domain
MASSTLVNRLRQQLNTQRLSVTALASKAKVPAYFLYDILHEKSANPSPARLAQVAEALGVTLDYLLGKGSASRAKIREAVSSPGLDDFFSIPAITVTLTKRGKPTLSEDNARDPYFFRRSWLTDRLHAQPDDLKLVYVQGDSMEPSLSHNDMVLADTSKVQPSPPGLFVIFDGVGLVVKRLEMAGASGNVRITSDNPQYPPYEHTLEEVQIIGRVVWYAREM